MRNRGLYRNKWATLSSGYALKATTEKLWWAISSSDEFTTLRVSIRLS